MGDIPHLFELPRHDMIQRQRLMRYPPVKTVVVRGAVLKPEEDQKPASLILGAEIEYSEATT